MSHNTAPFYSLDESHYGAERGTSTIYAMAGRAPCDGCLNWHVCRDGYACRDFAAYVNSGRLVDSDRAPRREIFKRLLGRFADMQT